ncbi:MAG: hypothetical protein FGM15_07380 [Chthoniobacterales bacterium]|nr:hypothetical protein [Chthoniobacterales bacterium]
MDYLKANYERLLLILAALFLLGAAFFAVTGMQECRTTFVSPAQAGRGAAFAPNESLAALKSESAKLAEPGEFTWDAADGSLFVSRVYLLRDGELVDIFESNTQLYPGVPNEWILQHELDYADRDLMMKDADADAFTNEEEFRAGSNPRDPESKPPLWSKLRLASYEKIPFRIKFMGAPSSKPWDLPEGSKSFPADTLFAIANPTDSNEPTQFLKIGDKIKGTELKIIEAIPKMTKNRIGADIDVSELVVQDLGTSDKIVLTAEKEVDSPYSYAIFNYAVTGEDIRVEKGKTFPLPPGRDSYKLIDADATGAVIESVSVPGERHTVPPASAQTAPAPESLPSP